MNPKMYQVPISMKQVIFRNLKRSDKACGQILFPLKPSLPAATRIAPRLHIFVLYELIKYLKEYDAKISRVFSDREYFFPGGYGGIYSSSAISANFRKIWLSAGLKRDGKVKPRAYDFRHHFACANIMRWSEEGKDIHAMLPYLMRYMGHSSLESTYYYIHLIPDYFSQYRILTSSSADVIPEVDAYEV